MIEEIQLKTTERKTCRLCESSALQDILSLGTQYISNFVEKDEIKEGIQAPLDLVQCKSCSLLQLRHTAPQELLYARHYWYRSGVTKFMKDALQDIVNSVETVVNLKDRDCVLDLGANDGTLLACYSNKNLIRIGCEPAKNLIEQLHKNTELVIDDFWTYENFKELTKTHPLDKAKVITAIGMFYDMEDPNQFVQDAQKALASDGVFIAQLMCLKPMLDNNDLGNICHEHLEFYSLESLVYLFEKNGLEIFKLEENNVNGGSYRIFCRHATGNPLPIKETISKSEIHAFVARVNENRDKCLAFIKAKVGEGKTVYVYGASTKGNVILQYYGLDSKLITAAAEKSPEKWGKYTVGTGIPIISEEQARAEQPDYFLVLPWGFFDEFYAREVNWRKKGGKFIVPLPEFRIV
jgi:hypothetical protein